MTIAPCDLPPTGAARSADVAASCVSGPIRQQLVAAGMRPEVADLVAPVVYGWIMQDAGR